MERAALRNAFHGEPDTEQEGAEVEQKGPDQVTVAIRGGKLILRVPNDLPDDQVLTQDNFDNFMQLVVELEDGSELTVTLDPSADIADAQFIPAAERGRESEG